METNTLFRGMAVEWGSHEEVGEVRLNPMPESRAVRDESPQTEPHIIRAFLSRAASQIALTTGLLFWALSMNPEVRYEKRVVKIDLEKEVTGDKKWAPRGLYRYRQVANKSGPDSCYLGIKAQPFISLR